MAMRQAGWRVSGSQLAAFTASLLAIANPIANLALFESMTGDNTPAERRKIAATALAAVIVTLAVVTWAGEAILDLFGISIGALEIAGGSILVTIAFQMVHGQESGTRSTEDERQERQSRGSIAIVPLTIPIVAGPGTMSTVLVQVHRFPDAAERLEITAVCVGVALANYLAFRVATPASRAGPDGGQRGDPDHGRSPAGHRRRDAGQRPAERVPRPVELSVIDQRPTAPALDVSPLSPAG